MIPFRRPLSALLLALVASAALADISLLNASYDVARDVFKDYNPLFQKYWKQKTGENLELKQSHGGSSKQVRAVADGLEADVVTMNQANDIEFLAEKGPGVHHLAFSVPDFGGARQALLDDGHSEVVGGAYAGVAFSYISTDRDLGFISEFVDWSKGTGSAPEPNSTYPPS